MMPEATTSLNATDEKEQAAFRRLLLAKQLYLHGLDHSNKADALNKMIAVHNFHNAIEIVLRAIFLHHDIRAEKQLNIEFEVMLNEINNHPPFKTQGMRLPYRQELRNLNQLRNLVQHHAVEPPSDTMEDWRVFTRRFLEQACQTYFGLEFNGLSPLDMIEDATLRYLLKLSLSGIEENDFKSSLLLAKVVFREVAVSMFRVFPDEVFFSSLYTSVFISRFHESDLKAALQMLDKKSDQAEYHAIVLSSGVSLADYKRFESFPPSFSFSLTGGKPLVDWGQTEPDEETARWVHDFVVTTIVRWQVLGLAPSVSDQAREAIQKLIEENDSELTFKSFLETYDSHHPKEPPQSQADFGEPPQE
jgi:hypothetical protein